MLDSLMPDEPAAPLELTPFVAAMPSGVREEIDRARRGEGPCAGWYRGHARHGRVRACNALANRVELASETFGWIVGITAFDDARQEVAGTLRRASFRDAAIPPALEAMATGIAAGRPTTPKLWATIEALAGRLPVVPKSLASALPSGVVSRYAIVRGAALRLAQKLGTAGREAIAAARGRSVGAELALLDDALAVLAGGHVAPAPTIDDVALLSRLLEAWRATRDPELERAIDRAGAAIARARGAIEAKSKSEL